MIPQDILDAVNAALSLEAHSVMEYIHASAWPAVINPTEQDGMNTLQSVWQKEETALESLAEAFGAEGGRIELAGGWRFGPSRFNFATPSHILSALPPIVEAELRELEEIRTLIIGAPKLAAAFDRVLAAKRSGLAAISAAAAKVSATRDAAVRSKGGAAAASAAATPAAGSHPWRNAKLSLADRLSAAAGKTLFERIWAAMAQTDCTACGYDCEGYAKAIVDGSEKDLTKCVPGESETADALKKLMSK